MTRVKKDKIRYYQKLSKIKIQFNAIKHTEFYVFSFFVVFFLSSTQFSANCVLIRMTNSTLQVMSLFEFN